MIAERGIGSFLTSWLDVKLHWLDHILRRKNCIKILLSENVMLENEIINTLSCSHGFLGDSCRILVADHRIESCYNCISYVAELTDHYGDTGFADEIRNRFNSLLDIEE